MKPNLLFRITAPAVLIGLALLGACLAGAWYIHRLQANMSALLTPERPEFAGRRRIGNPRPPDALHTLVYLASLNKEPSKSGADEGA